MDDASRMQGGVGGMEDEAILETQCYLCQHELPDGEAVIASKCGVNFHEDCAKRSVVCPACGENLLEHFLNQGAKDKIVFKDRLYTMLLFFIPFLVIFLIVAFISADNHPSQWSILPWMGMAFILDIILLILGIIVAVLIFSKFGYKPEKITINALVLAQKGPTPGVADEQTYTCGYGDRVSPTLFGDVSIPNKAGVQKENVVRVAVDRLTRTADGTFVWLNPRFLKMIKAKDNPQPSNEDELEGVWKATGRTKLSESAGEGAGDKLCSTCQNPLEYIGEYDAHYCSSCGKYEERPDGTTPDEELPPPEE